MMLDQDHTFRMRLGVYEDISRAALNSSWIAKLLTSQNTLEIRIWWLQNFTIISLFFSLCWQLTICLASFLVPKQKSLGLRSYEPLYLDHHLVPKHCSIKVRSPKGGWVLLGNWPLEFGYISFKREIGIILRFSILHRTQKEVSPSPTIQKLSSTSFRSHCICHSS